MSRHGVGQVQRCVCTSAAECVHGMLCGHCAHQSDTTAVPTPGSPLRLNARLGLHFLQIPVQLGLCLCDTLEELLDDLLLLGLECLVDLFDLGVSLFVDGGLRRGLRPFVLGWRQSDM